MWATTADVEAWWRPLTPDEEAVAETRIKGVEAYIKVLAPGIQGRIDAGNLDVEAVKYVVCQVVKRTMDTPETMSGVNQMSNTAGPYSQQFGFSNPNSDLYFTKQEKRILGIGSPRAWSVDTLGGA